ncbi:MAG TPA: ABC transporter permease subunit [Pirellulales bacterium]
MLFVSAFPPSLRSRSRLPRRNRLTWLALLGLAVATVAPFVFADHRTAGLAANTLLLAGVTVGLSVPLGSTIALVLVRTDLPCRRLLGGLLAGFLFLPLYVQAGAWQAAFGLEGWATMLRTGPAWLAGWRGAVWVHTVAAVPWVVLFVAAGLRRVERELEEDALLDAGPPTVVCRVTLPRARGAVAVAALWVALTTAGEMAVTSFFQVRTYADELFTEYALGDVPLDDLANDSLLARVAAVVGIPPGVLQGIATSGWAVFAALLFLVAVSPLGRAASQTAPLVFIWKRGRWLALTAAIALAALLLLLPLASLAWKAGVLVSETATGRQRTWSLEKCLTLIASSPHRYRRELGWSLLIDGVAASTAVAIAFPLAWLGRGGTRRAWLAIASVGWLLAVPGPVIGLSIIAAMNCPEVPWLVELYDRSIAAPLLATVAHALPLAMLVLWPSLRSFPQESIESAAVDGAGLWTRWWRIVLPQRWAALATAWLVAFAWSLGELDAGILVTPPGVETLSIRIFRLLHFGVDDQVAGVCLAFYLAVQAVAAAAWWLAGGRRDTNLQPHRSPIVR